MMPADDKKSLEQKLLGCNEEGVSRTELIMKLQHFKTQFREKLSSFIYNLPELEVKVAEACPLEDDGDFDDIVIEFPWVEFYKRRLEGHWDKKSFEWVEYYDYEHCDLEGISIELLKEIADNIDKAFESYFEYVSGFFKQIQKAREAISQVTNFDLLQGFTKDLDSLVSTWDKKKNTVAEILKPYLDSLPTLKYFISSDKRYAVEFPSLELMAARKDKYGGWIYKAKQSLKFYELVSLEFDLPLDAYMRVLEESPEVPEWGCYPLKFSLDEFEKIVEEYCSKRQ